VHGAGVLSPERRGVGVSELAIRIRRLASGGDGDESHGHLFRSTHALMLTTVVNGALGFGFWVLAARLYSADLVGINSALIAIMTTIATLSQFSLGVMFIRFLPESNRPRRMILIGYALSAAAAVVIAALLAIIVPRISGDVSVLRTHPWLAAVWVASAALWCVFGLQDRALTALRFTKWVPLENGVFGAAKIVVLLLMASIGAAEGILFAWVVPMVLLILPVTWLVFGPAATRHRPVHQEGVVLGFGKRRVLKFLGFTGLATVFDQGMQAAIPLLVVGILGASENAYFYIPFTITMTVEILIDSGAIALTVEGSFAATRLRELTVSVVRRLLVLVTPVIVALIVFAPIVLIFFGRAYVDHSTTVLRLLAVATVLRGAIGVFVGVCRVQGRGVVIFIQSLATAIFGVVFIAFGAHAWGLNGVGLAWLAANALVAIVSLPLLWHFMRDSRVAADSDTVSMPGAENSEDEHAAYYPSAVWGAMVPPDASIAAIDEDALDDELRRHGGAGTDGQPSGGSGQ
jgi:O-antigen/teichoic acid export membrane protein